MPAVHTNIVFCKKEMVLICGHIGTPIPLTGNDCNLHFIVWNEWYVYLKVLNVWCAALSNAFNSILKIL